MVAVGVGVGVAVVVAVGVGVGVGVAVVMTQDGWQPIATAPKDGMFLVVKADGNMFVISGEILWRQRTAKIPTPEHLRFDVTHWMPLPPPPETRAVSEVYISREAVEKCIALGDIYDQGVLLLALRDALDKAEQDVAFQAQRAATSEAEISELKANELRLHQIIYKLSDEPKELRATIARQQRAIAAAHAMQNSIEHLEPYVYANNDGTYMALCDAGDQFVVAIAYTGEAPC